MIYGGPFLLKSFDFEDTLDKNRHNFYLRANIAISGGVISIQLYISFNGSYKSRLLQGKFVVVDRYQKHTDTRKTGFGQIPEKLVSKFLEKLAISVNFITKSLQKHKK